MSEATAFPTVATIGAFDGVHLGHRFLLGRVAARAAERGARSLAVTFEPLPPQVLRPDRFPGRLCTPQDKRREILDAGVGRVAVVPFDRSVAAMSPETFVGDLVVREGIVHLVVGEDFALGKDRAGNPGRLAEIGRELGFTVETVARIAVAGEEVSSSAIRAGVMGGDVATARRLLGRPFRVGGEVVHGKKLGRTIGFPTANVEPPADLAPLADGIYAAWAWLPADAAPRPAITYVGNRPTVNTGARVVETHLLDFAGDLYGLDLRVDLLERLRPDAQFPSLDDLIAQMKVDEAGARAVLARETAVAC